MFIKENLKDVPNTFGCYLWKDESGIVIYVGKAVKLQNRMKQYFDEKTSSPKTKLLVKHIASFEYMLVKNEIEALILELELIKKYNPKYNIRLKNQKSYPYIVFEKYPILKLELTNTIKKQKKDAKYFGPFPDGYSANKVKKIIESIYPVSKCLSPNSGAPCLNYQMGICPGYCFKKLESDDIDKIYKKVESFLKGDNFKVKKIINQKIESYISKKMYEQAQKLHNLLPAISKYSEKQEILFKDNITRDIIGYYFTDDFLSIAILNIRFGKLITKTSEIFPIAKINYENIQNLVDQYLYDYYQKNFKPQVLVIKYDTILKNLLEFKKVIIPQKGQLLSISNLALKEATEILNQSKFKLSINEEKLDNVIIELKNIINIKNLSQIEIIDISNLSGENQVGVVVNFKNREWNKSLYRKYNLEDYKNDYKAIYEVTYRHFRRKLLENIELPDLYIVDGKHQIENAKKALDDLNLSNKIKVIGLVKNSKHDTEKIINENNKIFKILPKSPLYLFLGKIQDEVHRFAITFYRKKQKDKLFATSKK